MNNLEHLTLSELRELRNELGKAIVESEQESREWHELKDTRGLYFKQLAEKYRQALAVVKQLLRRKLDEIIGIEEGGEG
jgi:hypothetical protein